MSYTVEELDAAISDDLGAGEYWDGNWHEFEWASHKGVDVPGFGHAQQLEQYGGEGQGDDLWQVFSITNDEGTRIFRKGGYHVSFDGSSYDQDLEEVVGRPKTVTEWVKL